MLLNTCTGYFTTDLIYITDDINLVIQWNKTTQLITFVKRKKGMSLINISLVQVWEESIPPTGNNVFLAFFHHLIVW